MIPFDILSSGLIQPPTSLGPTVLDLGDFGAAGSIVLTEVDDKGLYIRSTPPPRNASHHQDYDIFIHF